MYGRDVCFRLSFSGNLILHSKIKPIRTQNHHSRGEGRHSPSWNAVCRKESSKRRQRPSAQHWGSPPTTSSQPLGVFRPGVGGREQEMKAGRLRGDRKSGTAGSHGVAGSQGMGCFGESAQVPKHPIFTLTPRVPRLGWGVLRCGKHRLLTGSSLCSLEKLVPPLA